MKIGADSLVLAESSVSGVAWVLGLVVYTGTDCRTYMAMNAGKRRKITQLERSVNRLMVLALATLLLLVVISLIFTYGLQYESYSENYVEKFLIFAILYNNIIPISMFVSMDIIRLIHSYFIERDLKFYD
jgi:magnesium-transporting ATPase (P-type)